MICFQCFDVFVATSMLAFLSLVRDMCVLGLVYSMLIQNVSVFR